MVLLRAPPAQDNALRFQYRTIEFGELDIHLRTLRDTNEFSDPTGKGEALGISPSMWPLFGVVWESSIVLAAMMANAELEGRRILEMGCGIGMPSLVLQHRGADITASDRHPEAGAFLAENAALNELEPVRFVRADWLNDEGELGRFDLLIGSDLLHDRDQSGPLSRFVAAHAEQACEVIVVDPGRGQAGAFSRDMEALGFAYTKLRAIEVEGLQLGGEVGARVHIHRFVRG